MVTQGGRSALEVVQNIPAGEDKGSIFILGNMSLVNIKEKAMLDGALHAIAALRFYCLYGTNK